VQTELGRISAPVPGAGGAVEVMVRPESLSLAGEGGEPAHVVASEYYGHDQMVTVRLDSGTLVKVREISGRDFPAGKRLGVRVSGDVVVYPRSPEAAALDASD
jgi:hypothetical protein